MTEALISMFVGGLLIKIHIVLVTWLLRLKHKIPPIGIHAFSAVLLLLILLILSSVLMKMNIWITFCVFAFGVSAYLFVFGAVYKSLSLRILLAIKSKGGRASFTQLDVLVTEASFAERAEILCNMNFAVKEGGCYRISKQGEQIAERIVRIRKLFGITTLGLYHEAD